MSKEVTVKEAGYAYVFVSNENPTLVDFYVDDVVITHTPTNLIQYNEYYPFGLQTSASWTRETAKDNNYLYNAANELNKTSGWYEMYYRGYDPAIGRMLQVDPYATMYASSTTYNYALNNPVMMNDPSGGQVSAVGYTDSQLHTMHRLDRIYNGGPADFGDWAMDNLDGFGAGGRSITGTDGEDYGFDVNGQIGRYGWVEYTGTRDGDVMWTITRWEKLTNQDSKKGRPITAAELSLSKDPSVISIINALNAKMNPGDHITGKELAKIAPKLSKAGTAVSKILKTEKGYKMYLTAAAKGLLFFTKFSIKDGDEFTVRQPSNPVFMQIKSNDAEISGDPLNIWMKDNDTWTTDFSGDWYYLFKQEGDD
jgi:RHS repeat-associated protein